MNNEQIFELIKAGRTPFVIDAEKLQAKLHELSQRKIKPSIDVYSDYESDEAKTLKEKISRNWAYPLYKKVVSALTMWTHQDITIEKKYTSTEVDQVLLSAYEGESLEYFINEVFSLNLFNKFNDFIIVDKTNYEPVRPIIYTIPITSVLYYETKGYNIQRLLYKIGSYKT